MREIKFRGWLKDCDTKIPYVEHFDLSEISQGSIMSRDSGWESLAYCIIEQYTGLKDRNGTEIYEGDIVRYGSDSPNEVLFKDSCFCCYLKSNDHILRLEVFNGVNKYVVIGNIHENPELLNA